MKVLIVGAVFLIALVCIASSLSDTISLNKSDWKCTKEEKTMHTQWRMSGKIMTPYYYWTNDCVAYEKT